VIHHFKFGVVPVDAHSINELRRKEQRPGKRRPASALAVAWERRVRSQYCPKCVPRCLRREATLQKLAVFAALAVAALPLAAKHAPHGVNASSHREAPLTSQYPIVDSTDVYAFRSPDKPDTVTLIANYVGLEDPAGGPNFTKFGDDVLYAINIDNVGDGQPHLSYQFQFFTTYQNPNTFLYNTGPITSLTDPNWNIRQSMRVTRVDARGSTVLGDNLPTPPVNVGAKSTPNYDALANMAIKDLGNGVTVFAGDRKDPFFVDLGSLFDLLQIRKLPGNMGGGVDALAMKNVHSIVIQVPITQLTNNGQAASDPMGSNAVIGVWTTASLQQTSVLTQTAQNGTNGPATVVVDTGPFVQVSRLGMPLTNEVLIPVGTKDQFNSTTPANDAQYAGLLNNPEPANLLKLLYNIQIPPTPRTDILAIFDLGVPGLNQQVAGNKGTPADELRLNMAIPVTATPNRMGVLAKDNQGFPNGRRLTDDVVDIELNALAGAVYPLIDPNFKPDPLAGQLGDGVDASSKPPLATFPYVASPLPGFP